MMYQPGVPSPDMTSQIAFVGPDGMTVTWDVSMPGAFDSEALTCPARYNFPQAAIYRLKLANIPGRPGIELYPTVEVGPVLPRTEAFLAHNAIPVQFTPEDFDQVQSGNFVTKVIYLPDPEFQELALAGVETLVSTRLDPGVDPIVEADRRGAILAIVRLGNKDLQIPNARVGEGGVAPASYQSPEGCPPAPGMSAPARRRRWECRWERQRPCRWAWLPASTPRNTECRCAARRSACPARLVCRWEFPPA